MRVRGRPARTVLLAVVTTLALAGAGIEVWARTHLDTSTVARAVVWMEADVDDIGRFPQRPIAAGEHVWELPDCARSLDTDATTVSTPEGRQVLAGVLESTRTRGFLVIHEDCVLAEEYAEGADADTLLTSFSVAKSVLATLVGIAVERGDLASLDEPLTTHLPELAERDPRFARIRLRDLMGMASGLRYEETGTPWGDDAETYYSPDLRATALAAEVVEPPGTRWLYNNYNPLLMGMVLERATGVPVATYAERHLWRPMGAEHDASWSLDSEASGLEKLESGVNATLRDWGRFGLLMARDGRAGARRVLDPSWVREATTAGDLEPRYALWWWVDEDRPGSFYAHGNFGQFVYVDPTSDVVVARFGRDYGLDVDAWPGILGEVASSVGP